MAPVEFRHAGWPAGTGSGCGSVTDWFAVITSARSGEIRRCGSADLIPLSAFVVGRPGVGPSHIVFDRRDQTTTPRIASHGRSVDTPHYLLERSFQNLTFLD